MNHKYILSIMATAVLAACTNEDYHVSPSVSYVPGEDDICISEVWDSIINPKCDGDSASTRVAYSGSHTSFENGDAIGVYAVNGNSIVSSNVKFTLTDEIWVPEGNVVYNPGYMYYAYYPYNASHGYTPDFTKATLDEQFATFIADAQNKFWMADQSTKSNFSASNLMIAQGEATLGRNIKFMMLHKRALAVINPTETLFENVSNSENNGVVSVEYVGNVPYTMDGNNYFLMKPNHTTSVGGIKLKCESGKYVNTTIGEITGEYTVQCALSSDGGATFGNFTSLPSWLTIADERIDGQPVKFKATFDHSGNTTSSIARTSVNSVNNDVLKTTTPVIGIVDLSMVDNAGKARTNGRTTANCYLVHAPGMYKFPLVYGNAIHHGDESSDKAYHSDIDNSYVRPTLVNHADQPIRNAWIKNNYQADGSTLIAIDAVELLWQDSPQVITSVGLDGDYATFTVSPDNISECNAVIVAKSGDIVVWSWHIWVTPETLSDLTTINTGVHTYDVAPVNVGWVTPLETKTTYAGYHCRVKISANSANYYFTVVQPDNTVTNSTLGHCTYYQWGRPIAEPGSDGTGNIVHPVYGINGNTALQSSLYPSYSSTSVTIGQNLQTPIVHYNSGSTNCPWNENTRNYWDMNQSATEQISTATIKTVYDPCPPDFCVPTGDLYYYIATYGSNSPYYGIWDDTKKTRTWIISGADLSFPATGYRERSSQSLTAVGAGGFCWSASGYLYKDHCARDLYYNSGFWSWDYYDRSYGFAVRAVKEE